MKITRKQIAEAIHVRIDSDGSLLSKSFKTGYYRARLGFYYANGDSQGWASRVSQRLTDAGIQHTIMEHSRVDKPFHGAKNTANNSHFYVDFVVLEGDK